MRGTASVHDLKPTARPWRRRLAAAALAGASIVALSAYHGAAPTMAQRADPGRVMTPMGVAPLTFADIVERVKPAVVSISVSSGGRTAQAQAQPPGGRGGGGARPGPGMPNTPEELWEFFRRFNPELGQGAPPRVVRSQGSGFVISEDGYVVTNHHVIDKATTIEVIFDTGDTPEKFEAKLVGSDRRTDLALLKIDAKRRLVHVPLARGKARVGDWVLAVGNPFGLGGTVTAGIVSALARSGIGEGPYEYLQIDAAVNRGNSGGPTFNLQGEVVGVNTAIYSPSGGNVGIAFAVPAETVEKVIAELKAKGTVTRGFLGINPLNLEDKVAKTYGLPDTSGALVAGVTAKGPAESAGLKVEDVILAVNGVKIKDARDLSLRIAGFSPGSTVELRIRRHDKDQVIKVALGRFPGADEIANLDKGEPARKQFSALGLSFTTTARRGPARDGVQVSEVEEGSDAAQEGIRAGDTITHVNSEAVNSPEDIEAVLKRIDRPSVRLRVKTEASERTVAVRVKKG